jgi:hypothetical protein
MLLRVPPLELAQHLADDRPRDGASRVLGRSTAVSLGVPDDIGPMIAALPFEGNRWVNAQRIGVSAGMFL